MFISTERDYCAALVLSLRGSGVASVVRQLEVRLFKAARARVTLAMISLALAVQMNGFGLALCTACTR